MVRVSETWNNMEPSLNRNKIYVGFLFAFEKKNAEEGTNKYPGDVLRAKTNAHDELPSISNR